jgi:hypothetical protein
MTPPAQSPAKKVGSTRLLLAHFIDKETGHFLNACVCERYTRHAVGLDAEYGEIARHATRQIKIPLRFPATSVHRKQITGAATSQFDK